MKKNLYRLSWLFCALLIFLGSCKKSEIEKDTVNSNSLLSIQQKVARLGFDTTRLVIKNDTIWVEGDIILTKSALNKTSPRQASTIDISNGVYPIDYSKHRYLKYYVASSLSSWSSAIQAAAYNYSVLPNFNLRFTQTTNQADADLIIDASFLSSGTVAEGYFPSNGQIGNRINVDIYQFPSLSQSQKTFLITHEIGHTIGFRHTDWRAHETEYNTSPQGVYVGAYTIPGTLNNSTNPDPSSVFNSGVGSSTVRSWSNFTNFDQIALKTMYPSFGPAELDTNPSGSYPSTTVSMGSQITANVNVPYWREGGLTYDWYVQGATIISNNGSSIVATVTDPSSAGVFCMISNNHGESTAVSRSFGPNAID